MKNFIKNKLFVTLVVAFIICLPMLSLAQDSTTPPTQGDTTTPPARGDTTTPPARGDTTTPPAGKNSTKNGDTRIKNPIGPDNINTLIKTILEGVIKIGIPIIALALIYSGFLFVAARGNSEKLSEAKRSLLYTIIGAAILLGAWTIAQLISETVLQIK